MGIDEDKSINYVMHSGINEWADSNNMVVLYPQATTLEDTNLFGCFDWVGYLGQGFATKEGPQIFTIANMINALIGRRLLQ